MAMQPSKSVAEVLEGQFAVYRELGFQARQIAKVTPKLVKFTGSSWPRQIDREKIAAAFDNEADAKLACQSLDGVWGEFNRRRAEADKARNERVSAARDAAEKQQERVLAELRAATLARTVQS